VESLGSLLGHLFALIADAYERAPILVLALSALLILPVVALISLAVQTGRRRVSRGIALRAAKRSAQTEEEKIKQMLELDPATSAAPQSQGWLTVEGRPGGPMPLAGDIIRIGRQDDNDIRLADRTVHRHHAVIERTADEAFTIKDISGQEGSGVRINGEPKAEALLADGDVIELGRTRLKFENAPV
jgi:type III secretion system (T3SS) inner membrane Yop/YscD-like protein